MVHTLLGVVDRFGAAKTGPGARLRPLFQASSDKARWISPEEDFPNSGVVSWWQPSPDAEIYKAWTFQADRSWTYDPDNEHHDYYLVKGTPSPAVELIDLPTAEDPEDVRSILLEWGLPLERCASKRLVFRDRSGSVVGPLDLLLRDGQLFLDEREALVPVNQWNDDVAPVTWEGHRFLPLEVWPRRAGEMDFSPNAVFLKRVLRDIRDMHPELIENAKLTEKLISSYTSTLEKALLTPLQRQRLKRLHKIAQQASVGIALGEEAVPDLLAIPAVSELISTAKEEAARSAVEERRAELNKFDKQRTSLESKVTTLQGEAERLQGEIESSRKEQTALLQSFDDRIQKRFLEIGKDASSFLTDIAVIRAALSTGGPARVASGSSEQSPAPAPLKAAQIVPSVRECFDSNGLGCVLPATLLASWASGCVPLLSGAMARDAINAVSTCLFGGHVHLATLGPSLSSPTDLLTLTTSSAISVSTVGDLVVQASRSEELFLLVFDNINLCQLDSTLVPLLRSYATNHSQAALSRSCSTYGTPVGIWPSNILLAGVLIDSALALPISRELWSCAAFVDASSKRVCSSEKRTDAQGRAEISGLSYGAWVEWLQTIDQLGTSETRLLATHVSREIESGSLFKNILRRLAAALDQTSSPFTEDKRAGLLAEMTIVPYVLSRGLHLDKLLEDAPAEVSMGDGFVDMLTGLFEKWGIEVP